MTTGFHLSAVGSPRLEGSILKCTVRNREGHPVESHLDLNKCVENINGHFEWEPKQGEFTTTAEDIRLEMRGGNPILLARLKTHNGEWKESEINLAERIINTDGKLEFV